MVADIGKFLLLFVSLSFEKYRGGGDPNSYGTRPWPYYTEKKQKNNQKKKKILIY
jgi:hypothetical protein